MARKKAGPSIVWRRRQWHPTPVLFVWKIPWTEEPGGLQSMGSLGVGHDCVTSLYFFHFHALEKEMATHSSVLALRIPGTGDPGGLPSMGLHRVGHNWSDLAAAAIVWGSPWDLFFKIKYHPMVIPAIRVKTSSFFHVRSELASCLSIICICLSIYHSIMSIDLPIVLSYLFIYVSVYPLIHLPIYSSIHPLIYHFCLSVWLSVYLSGLAWWLSCKESACQSRRLRFDPWVGKIPWRRELWPTAVFLPGESHGQRSLLSYCPRGHKRIRRDLPT